ncbi:MAG: YhdP family protein, partial [Steroidobacteraceae bacterium]
AFSRVAGDIRVQRDATTISVEAEALELSRPGVPWRPSRLDGSLTRKDGRVARIAARADYLRIENLAALAVALPPGKLRDRIATLAPRGELFDLDLDVADVGGRRLPDITGRLRFEDVGFDALGKIAGVTGFDGTIEGRGAGGIVDVATRDATLDWPQQLRAPVPVVRADARVEWQRFDTGVRFWLDDVFADSGHGSARGKLRLVLRPGELPLMDVEATASGFDVTQTWRYLQTGRLKPKTIQWLDAAFRAGRVTQAEVSITGPFKGFPYREGQGVFRARGHVTGVSLHFAPGWPELRGVESDFTFDGPALHAVASRGSIGGVAFTSAEINSSDLKGAVFAASGRTETDAGRALRMLQSTPLAPSFGESFADLAASGPFDAELTMYLPVKEKDRRVVTVHANLGGVSVADRKQSFEARDITGEFWVRNREIQAPALEGRALGGRWRASIATIVLGDGNLRSRVEAEGTVQGSALAPIARMPVNAGLVGTTGWRGSLEVLRNADPKVPARGSLRLASDLRGLASALPEPFAKSADSALPLALASSFDGTTGPRIEGSLGREVRALL